MGSAYTRVTNWNIFRRSQILWGNLPRVWRNKWLGLYASTCKIRHFDSDIKGSAYNTSRLISEYIRYMYILSCLRLCLIPCPSKVTPSDVLTQPDSLSLSKVQTRWIHNQACLQSPTTSRILVYNNMYNITVATEKSHLHWMPWQRWFCHLYRGCRGQGWSH